MSRIECQCLVEFGEGFIVVPQFDQCNAFGLKMSFEKSILDHSTFYQVRLIKTTFKEVQLIEVDFTECDLTGSIFDTCDLTRSTFENTIIEKVDFRTSFNFTIDPEINRMKQAKFALIGVHRLLDKYDIQIEG